MSDEGMSFNSGFDESSDEASGPSSWISRLANAKYLETRLTSRILLPLVRRLLPHPSTRSRRENTSLPHTAYMSPLANRRSKKVQKRALPYPTPRPRRNMQVDDDELGSSGSSLVLPSGASHLSLGSISSSSSSLSTLSSPAKKVMLELEPDALACPICNFIPRGAIDNNDARGSTSKGLSSERRRTLRRHFDSHFSSSRVICYEKPGKSIVAFN